MTTREQRLREDEPAFPINGPVIGYQYAGLSVRDYFAAKVIASMFVDRQACVFSRKDLETFATCAYEMADAMLKARKEPGQ